MGLNFVRNIIIINIFVIIFCFFTRNDMPSKIDSRLKSEPKITLLTKKKPFEVATGKNRYLITEKKDFQTAALVMKKHIIMGGFDDDFRAAELCLTSGENLKNDSYKKIDMSGSGSCGYFYPAGSKFKHNLMTSNTMLSLDKNILEQIKRIKTGDQISIQGQLIDYQLFGLDHIFENESSHRPQHRNIYVSKIEILKKNSSRFPLYISILTLATLIILWSDLESHYHKKYQPEDN